jgi:hypothetical protein
LQKRRPGLAGPYSSLQAWKHSLILKTDIYEWKLFGAA